MSSSRTQLVERVQITRPTRPAPGVDCARAETRRSNRRNPARRWRLIGQQPLTARVYPPEPESRWVSASRFLSECTRAAVVAPDIYLPQAAGVAGGYSPRHWSRIVNARPHRFLR